MGKIKKCENSIWGFEPRTKTSGLDRHWNGFLLTLNGRSINNAEDSEFYFQTKGPGFAPHAEWLFIFLFKSDYIIRNNTPIFVSQIILSSGLHIQKLNDTEMSSIALVQGYNTKLWRVPHFLTRTTPFDMIRGGKLKMWKFYLGIRTQDQDVWTGIEMGSCWPLEGRNINSTRIVRWTSNQKVLGVLPMWNGCLYFDSNLTKSSEIIRQFLSVKSYFLRQYIY